LAKQLGKVPPRRGSFYTSGEGSRIEEKGGKKVLEISITLLIQEKVGIASGESPSVKFSSGVRVMTKISAGPLRVQKT
jgi:hypothetical protein